MFRWNRKEKVPMNNPRMWSLGFISIFCLTRIIMSIMMLTKQTLLAMDVMVYIGLLISFSSLTVIFYTWGRILFTLHRPYMDSWRTGLIITIVWNAISYIGFIILRIASNSNLVYNIYIAVHTFILSAGFLLFASYYYRRMISLKPMIESPTVTIILRRATWASMACGIGSLVGVLIIFVLSTTKLHSNPAVAALIKNVIFRLVEVYSTSTILWFIHPRVSSCKNNNVTIKTGGSEMSTRASTNHNSNTTSSADGNDEQKV